MVKGSMMDHSNGYTHERPAQVERRTVVNDSNERAEIRIQPNTKKSIK